jgi:flagellar motor switch protein FliM
MAKILSQDEVDALLNQFSSTEESEKKPAAEHKEKPQKIVSSRKSDLNADKNVSLYNFRRPDRVSKEQLRSLHYIHDRFARNFSSSLSAYLRALIDVSLYSVEQFTYAEFILSLPDPTYFNAISMSPLEGSVILEMNPKILFPMIDKILGGKGEDFGGGSRSITDIEKELIEGVVKLILRDLENAWKQIIKLTMKIVTTETSPQLIQVVAPNEIVVLVVFEIKVAEARGFMNFCIPAIVLEPIAHRFSQDWYADRAKANVDELKKLKINLFKTDLTVEAGIYGNKILIKDLLDLEAGSFIKLESKITDEIKLKINGAEKFTAYPVQVNDRLGVQVIEVIKKEFKDERE